MRIDGLMGILPETSTVEKLQPTKDSSFIESLTHTNSALNEADSKLQHVVQGDNIPLHEVMLSLNEAKLSLQFITQIRNRLLSAYQELMREQI